MSEKRFTYYYERGNEVVIEENGKRISTKKVVEKLNEQQSTISQLKEKNEQLRKENFFLDYWKRKAMILLMQVRRLTPRMTDKEVIEFSKELDDE